ncbi:MAG TPA: hypothetical protein VF513_18390 [Stenotrophomonas sp.]
MTKLLMTRIDVPGWARPFAMDIDAEFGARLHQAAESQMAEIHAAAHQLVQRYVDDVADDMLFPDKGRMTGDYYVSELRYDVSKTDFFPEAGAHRLSLFVRCLEHPFVQQQTDLDYLGLEVHFLWNEESASFEATGDIDSSSI